MTHLPWMPLYIGDELARTSHFTAEEFGAYISLIMHYWQHGGLPDGDARLARIARSSVDRWPVVKEIVAPLFEEGWILPRLEEQRSEAEITHKRRVEAGRKGGRPRREEKAGHNPGYKPGFSPEKAGPKHPQPQPQPHPYSDSDPEAHSRGLALEKQRGEVDPRESMFAPLSRPRSPAKGLELLRQHGIPQDRLEEGLERLMRDDLSRFDIEGWIQEAEARHEKTGS